MKGNNDDVRVDAVAADADSVFHAVADATDRRAVALVLPAPERAELLHERKPPRGGHHFGSGGGHGRGGTALTTPAADFGGVDLFFSNQWPRGITAATSPGPARRPEFASGTVAVAAAMLRPRYHFAGSEEMAWARTPYRSQAAVHITRFVALSRVILTKVSPFSPSLGWSL